MRILFCNIGWMEHYNGQTDKDIIVNGGAFVKKYGYGYEEFTFKNRNGYCYGGTGETFSMHIERIEGISRYDDKAEGVLVVWVAKKDNEDYSRIIGWYKNATVYREVQEMLILDGEMNRICYRVKANAKDCVLLVSSDRNFIMPRASKSKDNVGMGRSNIWYADDEKAKIFIDRVVKYINEFNKKQCNLIITEDILHNNVTNKVLNSTTEYIEKAYELSEKKMHRDALEYINKALEIDNTNEYAHNCKGNIIFDIGLYDLAIDCYRKALSIREDYLDPMYNIPLAYGMYGDLENALKYINEYLEIEKDDEEANDDKCLLEKMINDYCYK